MSHFFKEGDFVTTPPRNGAQHRGRAKVVVVGRKKITVRFMPDHPKSDTAKFKPEQLRYWLKGNVQRNKRTHG